MIDNILQFIQVYDKRIFIDVASNGCGNGCVYCFTKNPEKPQTLLNISTIDEIRSLAKTSKKVIAIGEIGLDYYGKEKTLCKSTTFTVGSG